MPSEQGLASLSQPLRRRWWRLGCGNGISPRMRERLEMVKAHLLGQDLAAIMRWTALGAHGAPGGWRGLPAGVWRIWPMPAGGRPAPGGCGYLEALDRRGHAALSLGLPFDVWTSGLLERLSGRDDWVHRAGLAAGAAGSGGASPVVAPNIP